MTTTGKWTRRAVWGALVVVLCLGCNPLQSVAFLLHKDDKVPAVYPLRPKEGPKHNKDEEITVLVICGQQQSGALPAEFVRVDREVASLVAKRMPEEAKENKEKIAVISPTQFDKFKIDNPNWRTMPAAKIGKKLGADFVLDINLSNIQVYQSGSRNMLYDGRAEVAVDVYDVATGPGEPKWHYELQYAYRPNHTPDATDGTGLSIGVYKQGFVNRLASEVIWKHLEHSPADGIGIAADH